MQLSIAKAQGSGVMPYAAQYWRQDFKSDLHKAAALANKRCLRHNYYSMEQLTATLDHLHNGKVTVQDNGDCLDYRSITILFGVD